MAFRYLGNKARLASWIVDTIASLVPTGARVVDPMCGTASVSRALADRRFAVTASDELRAPVLHARARLLHTDEYDFSPVASSYLAALRHLNELSPTEGLFSREYGGGGRPTNGRAPRRYFSAENAAKIDAVRSELIAWRKAGLDELARDLLLHDLVLAANEVANISGTYGYFLKSWSPASLRPLTLKASALVPAGGDHRVLQGKVQLLAEHLDADAWYLDPPYTKRQYAGNYHIPETLAREDEPDPVGDGGLRDWYSESSDFCLKRRAPQALREVVKRIESRWIFLSYSEDGQIPPERLHALLEEFGRVRRSDFALPRFRSNGAGASGVVTEHLYIVDKR